MCINFWIFPKVDHVNLSGYPEFLVDLLQLGTVLLKPRPSEFSIAVMDKPWRVPLETAKQKQEMPVLNPSYNP